MAMIAFAIFRRLPATLLGAAVFAVFCLRMNAESIGFQKVQYEGPHIWFYLY